MNQTNRETSNDKTGQLLVIDFRHWREQSTNSGRYVIRPKRSQDNSLINTCNYYKKDDFNYNKFQTLAIIHRIYKNCPVYRKNMQSFGGINE